MTTAPQLIVLATDFSSEAGRAYGQVVAMAKKLGAQILLVHVVESLPISANAAPLAPVQLPLDMSVLVKSAKLSMAQEVQKLGTSVRVQVACVPGVDVARTIVELAAERGASFIAISTHGRTGLRRLVLGSVAEAVVRHATVPVICYPAK